MGYEVHFKIKHKVAYAQKIAVSGEPDDLGAWKSLDYHLEW